MSKPDPTNIDVAEDVVLQYGKFKDESLEDIPDNYLLWIAENHESEFLCVAADTVYKDRNRYFL